MNISVKNEGRLITGHVLDVAKAPLEEALQRYDTQLYLKWNSKKTKWELRRRPEFKSVRVGRYLDTPKKGRVFFPGDVYEFDGFTLAVPKYHETSADCIKTLDRLDYSLVEWVAKQDLWQYGFKGKEFARESEYQEAKYEEKIDEESYAEKVYGFKQMRTQIQDFKQYIADGNNPYRLIDYWK